MASLMCPKCQTMLEMRDSFCGSCGYNLSDQKSCTKCGYLLYGAWRYCPNCGERLGLPENDPPQRQPATSAPRGADGGSNGDGLPADNAAPAGVHDLRPVQAPSSAINVGDSGYIESMNITGQKIENIYHINKGGGERKNQDKYAGEILCLLKANGSDSLNRHRKDVEALDVKYELDPSVAFEIRQRMESKVRLLFHSPNLGLSFDGGQNVMEDLTLEEVVDNISRPTSYSTHPVIDFERDRKWRNVWKISDILSHPDLVMRCASNGQVFPKDRLFVCPICGRLFEKRAGVVSADGICIECDQVRMSSESGMARSSQRKKDVAIINDLEEMGLIFLEPGKFFMGSDDQERHRQPDEIRYMVRIAQPFGVLATPVTLGMFNDVMGDRGKEGDRDFPVTGVTWYDCLEFCNRLSGRLGMKPCYAVEGKKATWKRHVTGIRLLTEAEWEYACRAGSQTAVPAGDFDRIDDCAYFGKGGLTRVAQLKPNAWDLYDMLGLVWEWVWSDYAPYPPDQSDNPTVISRRSNKVLRGGCYRSEDYECRCACRNFTFSSAAEETIGFRIAVTNP